MTQESIHKRETARLELASKGGAKTGQNAKWDAYLNKQGVQKRNLARVRAEPNSPNTLPSHNDLQ